MITRLPRFMVPLGVTIFIIYWVCTAELSAMELSVEIDRFIIYRNHLSIVLQVSQLYIRNRKERV